MAAPALISSRYEIRGVVGRGGMGLVYKAFDRVIGREVALKTLVDLEGRVAVEMFYKEWRTLAGLHHPNIIEIFDIGEFDDGGVVKPFFVMPLLPGTTLDHLLKMPGQQLSPDRLCEIVSQVCRGLQAIHDSGLVHRDIKPSNIFVMEFNAVKVIDFGVAHLLGGNTVTGLKGTVNYMAPEQIQMQECSAASDIFSLGVVCYEALCGVRPFQGKTSDAIFDAILHQNPPPVCEINPAVSQMVSRVIHKSLAKQPRHRYASALEFADTLQRAFRGEPIPALDPSRIQPRIQRAIRAFEQGNYQMATDILSDLEAAGHFDPALKPLRNKIDQALHRNEIRNLLDRAQMGIEEEEFTLALQNAEAALKIEPANEEALRLRETIQAKIAERELAEWLRGAEDAIGEYAFARARQLLRNVLDAQPGDPQAAQLLEVLEDRERSYRAARQEKEQLYRAAREAYENSEFATAAAKLERVLQLESNAPDTASPESGTNYSSFLSLVRSAQMVVENTRAAALDHIRYGRYEAAMELCRECMAKYPGHPVPQGLLLLAESERKRDTLMRMGDAVRAIGQEPDLERKLDLLKQAMEEFPGEPLLDQWIRPVRDRLTQVKTVIAKAQAHEERGRVQEAREQWQSLGTIYPEFTGLRSALERLDARASEPVSVAPADATTTMFLGPVRGGTVGTATALAGPATAAATPTVGAPVPAAPVREVRTVPPPAVEPATLPQAAAEALSETQPVRRRTTAVGPLLAQAGEWSRTQWSKARVWLSRTPGLFKQAGWALGAALAVLAIIGAAIVFHPRSAKGPVKTPPTNSATPRVKLVLRSPDKDLRVRIGDTALAMTNGEAQVELAPGEYPLSADREGYESFSDKLVLGSGGLSRELPPLVPLATALHVSTDLQHGKVRLDNRPEADVQNGEYSVQDVGPGEHKLVVYEGNLLTTITFTTVTAQSPVLSGQIDTRDLQVLVLAGLGGTAQVTGRPAVVKASLDGGLQGSNEQGVFVFRDLQSAAHQAIVVQGKDERRFAFDAGSRPLLRLVVSSDRNVGGVRVMANVERFHVFLDSVMYDLPIRDGFMTIPNLAAKSYKIRVTADGYEPAPEHETVIKKGGLISEVFKLNPLPQFATLLLRGMPPRTQVLMDGAQLGAVDGEGNFSNDRVAPGDHGLEFRNLPQYKPVALRKSFGKNETVTITSAEARMELNPAEVVITATPETAQLEAHCGQETRRGRSGMTLSCNDSQLNVRATAEGFVEETKPVTLNRGIRNPVEIALKRATANAPAPKRTCSNANLPGAGWAADQTWFTPGARDAVLPCEDIPGTYVVTIRGPKGILAKAVTWRVQGTDNSKEFTLEKKSFRGSERHDLGAAERDGAVTFRIQVEPGRITHEVRQGNSWQQLEASPGDFRKVKIVFPKDVRISGFSFTEK